jgi:hypothetical protein
VTWANKSLKYEIIIKKIIQMIDYRSSRRSRIAGPNADGPTSLGVFRAPSRGPGSVAGGSSRVGFRGPDRINPGYVSSQQENDSLNDSDEEEEEEEDETWATSTDNWTDYDQDIYMHRNSTKYGGRHRSRAAAAAPPMMHFDDVNL